MTYYVICAHTHRPQVISSWHKSLDVDLYLPPLQSNNFFEANSLQAHSHDTKIIRLSLAHTCTQLYAMIGAKPQIISEEGEGLEH